MRKILIILGLLLVIFLTNCSEEEKIEVIVKQLPTENNPDGEPNNDLTWQEIYLDNILSVPKIVIECCWLKADFCYECGHGSGFVVADGVVATNYHVGGYYTKIDLSQWPGEVVYYKLKAWYPAEATLFDNQFLSEDFEVQGIYGISEYDLALLKVETLDRKPVQLSKKKDLQILDGVMAMGYPLGFDFVATTGRITDVIKNEDVGVPWINQETKLIIHDAQIDAGNSGGPLFNKEGEVIGVNFALRVGYVAHSMAISVDYFKKIPISYIKFETRPPLPNPDDYKEEVIFDVISELNPVNEWEVYEVQMEKDCMYRLEAREVTEINGNPVKPIAVYYYVWDPNSSLFMGDGDTYRDLVFLCNRKNIYYIWIRTLDYTAEPGWYNLQVRQFCPTQ